MKFFVPGKTFLVGEYAVLLGGAALGLATRPYFEFDIDEQHNEQGLNLESEFHPDSPAGLYLSSSNRRPILNSFKDNYAANGAIGGFGKSTAEYFAAITPDLLINNKSFFDILAEYKNLHAEKTIKPSGIDLAFQYFGNVTLADSKLQFYQTFDWNFSNLDFFIISSGMKIATHEHLARLNLEILKDLPAASEEVILSFSENNENDFLYRMGQWCELLESKGLTHLNSLHLKKFLEKKQEIKLVKPCGALGADVLIVFFDKLHTEMVRTFLQQNSVKIQAHSYDLATGLGSQLKSYWGQHVD